MISAQLQIFERFQTQRYMRPCHESDKTVHDLHKIEHQQVKALLEQSLHRVERKLCNSTILVCCGNAVDGKDGFPSRSDVCSSSKDHVIQAAQHQFLDLSGSAGAHNHFERLQLRSKESSEDYMN